MSKHTNGPEDLRLREELGRELHQRADRFQTAPLTFDDVRGRASRIQRTRRITAAAAVAAAVAIIVPVGMLAGQGLNRAETIPPASQGPSETPSPTSAAQPDPGPHQLAVEAARGPAAAVSYLEGRTLVRPDGSRLVLPQQYDVFHEVGDEVLGFSYAEGSVDVIDADGEITRSVPGVTGLTGNAAQAVWSTTDGALVGWTDGTDSLLATPGGEIEVKAVTGDLRTAVFTVYFDRGHEQSPMKTVNGEPAEPVAPEGVSVSDAGESGRAALQVSWQEGGSCSGVTDTDAAAYAWQTCGHSLSTFSPGETYVLAPPAYRDALGDPTLGVLDAGTGDLVTTYEIDGGFLAFSDWEDEDHLLAVTYDEQGWRLLRLGLDGSIELVAGPVTDADEMSNPFRLPGTP